MFRLLKILFVLAVVVAVVKFLITTLKIVLFLTAAYFVIRALCTN